MDAPSTLQIPRAAYGACMALATAAALAATWATARSLGGGVATVNGAVLAFAIGSVLTFGPVVLRIGHDHWGVAVLFCGMGRGLVTLAAAYTMAQNDPGLGPRPLYLGAGAGVLAVLVVESVAAITILSKLERRRAGHSPGAGAPHATGQA